MAARQAMVAGHFGFAAAVKAKAPSVPLWALMLASQWLDVVFIPLFAMHIETIDPIQGGGSYGAVIIHADYTHSLVGAALLSIVFGALFAWRYGRVAASVLGMVAMSHWVLDLIVHRGDMPILPGGQGILGFGLWRYPTYSIALELALVAVGSLLYWRAAPAGRLATICGIAVFAAGLLTLALNVLGL